MRLRTPPLVLEGQCGTQLRTRFHPTVVLVSSYPLKPHGRSASFQIVHRLQCFLSLMVWGLVAIFGSVWWCTGLCTYWFFFSSLRVRAAARRHCALSSN